MNLTIIFQSILYHSDRRHCCLRAAERRYSRDNTVHWSATTCRFYWQKSVESNFWFCYHSNTSQRNISFYSLLFAWHFTVFYNHFAFDIKRISPSKQAEKWQCDNNLFPDWYPRRFLSIHPWHTRKTFSLASILIAIYYNWTKLSSTFHNINNIFLVVFISFAQ